MDEAKERVEPLVSVVVLTYNHVGSIARCLDSVLEQKTDFQFEVLVADDASTDGTSDIVRDYASRNTHIVPIVREQNLGPLGNSILVLKSVKSEYFLILEGDDYMCDPQKLQLQVNALRRHPECSCCAHPVDIRDKNGNHISHIGRAVEKDETIFDIYHAPMCQTASVLYRNYLLSFTARQWEYFGGDVMCLMTALDRGDMVYLRRTMSVYNDTESGMWSGLSKEEQRAYSQLLCYRVDHFLDFKYTKMLQHKYLPGGPKTLLTITIPFFRGRKFLIKLQKCKPWRAKSWR